MSEMAEIQRDLGKMEAELLATRELLAELRADVKAMRDDWTAMKSGTRVFMAIAAVIGAALIKVLDWTASHLWK